MKTLPRIYLLVGCLAATWALPSCKMDDDRPEDPPSSNSAELITKVTLEFTDLADTSQHFQATFHDLDGDAGNPPTQFDTIRLSPNASYAVFIQLRDEYLYPDDDISAEVQEEGDEHIFCFTPSGIPLTITRTDTDGTHEIGLYSRWETGPGSSTGTLRVELKHQPGIKDGTCAPGDTDVQLDFVTQIQ